MVIRSVASSIPERRVSNDEVVEAVRRASAAHLSGRQMERMLARLRTLFRRSGASFRRWRDNGEPARDFAVRASRQAIEQAGLGPADIDLLIYVGVGRGWVEPATANYFAHALGLRNATCFDILDACLSWLRALHVAHHFLKNGVYRNILVLNAEFNSREYRDYAIKHPDELEYRFAQLTIGEAATATVLSRGDSGEEPYFEFKTDSSLHTLCKIPLPQISEYSDGEKCPSLDPLVFFAYSTDLFRAARRMIAECYRRSAELRRRSYDIAFAHSASKSLTTALDRDLGGNGRTVDIFEEFGNTVSASIPLAMCWAIEQGRLRRGMKMLHVAGSAGFSIGFAHLVY